MVKITTLNWLQPIKIGHFNQFVFTVKEIFRELNWQPLADHWKKTKLMFTHKVKSNELPASMNNLFKIANNQIHILRSNSNDFLLQKPKTNYMKKSITYNGAIAWHKLSNDVKFKPVLDRK